MTERTVSLINIPSIGRVERTGLAVTGALMIVTYFLGWKDLAVDPTVAPWTDKYSNIINVLKPIDLLSGFWGKNQR